jgi:hypothetical protein
MPAAVTNTKPAAHSRESRVKATPMAPNCPADDSIARGT